MIYLDNAASSHPKPPEVARAVFRQIKENGANPGRSGHDMAMAASRTVYETRQTMADFFGTEAETVIFTSNTTDAVNRAIKGIVKAGDHVVISDLEHNSVLRPLVSLRDKGIITFDVARTGRSADETVTSFLQKIRPNTKLVFCTHASNVTGQILPVKEIGQACRSMGILFGVDGAQTAGILPYDLRTDPIDLLCVPGHKGLLGPQGTGALILARPLELEPLTEGGTGADSLSERQPLTFPEGYESGTLNTPSIAGLGAGISYVRRHQTKIRAREDDLRNLFAEEMRKISGYQILGDASDFVGTVSLVHERTHSERLAQWLNRQGICVRGGFHCSALAHRRLQTEDCGALRISFGYRNTVQDLYECVKNLKKYQNYLR